MKVHIFLASFRGQKFLPTQLESILNQQGVSPIVHISDDESALACSEFLFQEISFMKHRQVIDVKDGPRQGVNANFLSLLHCSEAADGEFYAFSDQDDFWLPNKLSVALAAIKSEANTEKTPCVYMGRTNICDGDLNYLCLSKPKPRAAGFQNALLELIAGGNTMVFNQHTLRLLKKIDHPAHHDWLTYLVVTACGGTVVFDDEPYVLYRQHGANVIGANNGIAQKLYRLKKLLNNEFRGWAADNIEALKPIVDDMTAENRRVYEGFVRLHHMRGWNRCFSRLSLFRKLGLYRQRRLEHFGFMLAAFCGKV